MAVFYYQTDTTIYAYIASLNGYVKRIIYVHNHNRLTIVFVDNPQAHNHNNKRIRLTIIFDDNPQAYCQ